MFPISIPPMLEIWGQCQSRACPSIASPQSVPGLDSVEFWSRSRILARKTKSAVRSISSKSWTNPKLSSGPRNLSRPKNQTAGRRHSSRPGRVKTRN
ncbi:unnamed protein product [Rhizoctonia solani]|uniref:Uncharacterized protein n=1 Tax=Rhizoctonia solani TaxID=456999 RepID=A0A8H2WNC9_9AGAM|nr:unnamed protein product [Rhizoctonia solani]